jgi:hypothetical protein
MRAAGVEMMGMLDAIWIGGHIAIFLPDLVTKLVEVEQLENVSDRSLLLRARQLPPCGPLP